MVTPPLTTRGKILFVVAGAVGSGLLAGIHALGLSTFDTAVLSILLFVDGLFVGGWITERYGR